MTCLRIARWLWIRASEADLYEEYMSGDCLHVTFAVVIMSAYVTHA